MLLQLLVCEINAELLKTAHQGMLRLNYEEVPNPLNVIAGISSMIYFNFVCVCMYIWYPCDCVCIYVCMYVFVCASSVFISCYLLVLKLSKP
jgi:hypothetical protein